MSSIFTDKTIYTGRPLSDEGRLSRELRVYDLLDSLHIPYERVDHEPADTIEVCREIDSLLQTHICKNLFLCNTQKTSFFLLMMPGNKKFKTSVFSKQMGCSRLSFADASYMEKFLDITPGSVSVLGLMNDTSCQVHLAIDQDIFADEYIGCHPCINTSSMKIKTADIIERFLPAVKHNYTLVDLP